LNFCFQLSQFLLCLSRAVKQALIEQLGLELVPAHKPVEMQIVEKVQ